MDSLSLNDDDLTADFGELRVKVLKQVNKDLQEIGGDFLEPFLLINGQVEQVDFNSKDGKYNIDLNPDHFQIKELFQKTVALFRLNNLSGAAAFPLDEDQLLVIFYQGGVFAALAGQNQGRTLTTRDFKIKELKLLSE
jgi:hypothetical protein